jgi:hypothetical protein
MPDITQDCILRLTPDRRVQLIARNGDLAGEVIVELSWAGAVQLRAELGAILGRG